MRDSETLSNHRYISVEQLSHHTSVAESASRDGSSKSFMRTLLRLRGDQAARAEAKEGYQAAKVALQEAIVKAKRGILNKLRPWAPPLTEKLDPSFVKRVVQTLFPENPGEVEPPPPSDVPHPD
ncbi:hypothetical protein KM043_000153 [Ampulex compressa]|nr:hypothetical protein KM043_000153 [Ampulex compressa]